jgi:hypothetical protein
MITKVLQKENIELQKRLFLAGSILLLGLIVYYCISINFIVFGIAQRKDSEANMHSLKSEIAEMELNYVALQNTVTLASADSYGLSEVAHPIFVGATKTLSYR